MNRKCSLIWIIPTLEHNLPWIAMYPCCDFSWNPYRWWRHHPFMTSLLPSWWRHMTQFNLIWFNLPLSMILPSFITNLAFFGILWTNSLIQEVSSAVPGSQYKVTWSWYRGWTLPWFTFQRSPNYSKKYLYQPQTQDQNWPPPRYTLRGRDL